jgi:hypothetical protein
MSKLSDRIKRSGKVEPAPIGFATSASRAASASMLTVVDTGADAGKIGDHAKKGADVVLWQGDAAALRKAKLPDGVILGVIAPAAGREEAAALREAGADFLVIDRDARGEALLDDKLGFVMAIADTGALEDAELRLMGELTLDALLVDAPDSPMSVGDVLALRRVAALARAPLIVRSAPGIEAGTLQLLRESGGIGVALDASSAGKLADLRKTIESLPERGRKGADKSEALVPASTSAGSHDHDDDDDFDE